MLDNFKHGTFYAAAKKLELIGLSLTRSSSSFFIIIFISNTSLHLSVSITEHHNHLHWYSQLRQRFLWLGPVEPRGSVNIACSKKLEKVSIKAGFLPSLLPWWLCFIFLTSLRACGAETNNMKLKGPVLSIEMQTWNGMFVVIFITIWNQGLLCYCDHRMDLLYLQVEKVLFHGITALPCFNTSQKKTNHWPSREPFAFSSSLAST